MTNFSYQDFTTRNIGFVSEKEQNILKNSKVFIPGVGGMGGAVVACLARMGVENFILADLDQFELSNLNRQIFSTIDSVGKDKAVVTKEFLLKINPNIKIELYNLDWVDKLDTILPSVNVAINGCDDVKSTIQLMRKCKQHNKSAVDAFASPLPSVYVIHPTDKRPEEAFGYPSIGLNYNQITKEIEASCVKKEIEHVMTHSNSVKYVDFEIAQEIIAGKRKRTSFAPMVWITGCLMAYEYARIVLNKKGGPNVNGIFYNPWTQEVERTKIWPVNSIRRYFVKRFLDKL